MRPATPPVASSRPRLSHVCDGIITAMQINRTEAKLTTVGLKNASKALRFCSVNTLEPIEAATNIRPTSVADPVPTRM